MEEKGELYKSMSKENQPLSEHIPLIAFSKKKLTHCSLPLGAFLVRRALSCRQSLCSLPLP
jgi:hypothetical protein